jgi:hypothetical protein
VPNGLLPENPAFCAPHKCLKAIGNQVFDITNNLLYSAALEWRRRA